MGEPAAADWNDVVRTIRDDLEVLSDDGATESAAAEASEEVWDIVDAFEDRVGSVDVDRLAALLGSGSGGGTGAGSDALEASEIPNDLVAEDPLRAARLRRLVALIHLDTESDYDVGRLWNDGGSGDATDSDDDHGERSDVGSGPEDAGRSEDASESGGDRGGEALREELGEALSTFRDRIHEAREDVADADESSQGSSGTGASSATSGTDDAESDGSSSSSSGRDSSWSRREHSTAFSTVPSSRRVLGGRTHLSTVPDRGHGSRSTTGPSSADHDERSPEEAEGE